MLKLRSAVLTSVFILSLLLQACGDTESSSSSGMSLGYGEAKTQVTFNEENAYELCNRIGFMISPFLNALYSRDSALNRDATRLPWPVIHVDSSTGDGVIEGNCGGTRTVKIYGDENNGREKIVYERYCSDEDTNRKVFDGTVTFSFRISIDLTGVMVTEISEYDLEAYSLNPNKMIVDDSIFEKTKGNVKYETIYTSFDINSGTGVKAAENIYYNVIRYNKVHGHTVWLDNCVINTVYDIDYSTDPDSDGYLATSSYSGRVYFGDVGYVSYSTLEAIDEARQSGVVVVDGANGSSIKFTRKSGYVWAAELENGDDDPPAYDDGDIW